MEHLDEIGAGLLSVDYALESIADIFGSTPAMQWLYSVDVSALKSNKEGNKDER
ncbi:MAG TPA: hypothetical protein PKW18_14160 [Candidatus Sumerlaeota bacterium]|nr:hypothetical protein [Candidatus Sumerlaeota bacterium]HOR65894.1 hypothetical protein [Candidatus Sumerlaeota bacterium]HPL75700.1 hypothetical protein [Candidatus Sumerlaeota bacterium]HRR31276.1 hypothetical protein [Candidatus Sumerlaeia bacterium]